MGSCGVECFRRGGGGVSKYHPPNDPLLKLNGDSLNVSDEIDGTEVKIEESKQSQEEKVRGLPKGACKRGIIRGGIYFTVGDGDVEEVIPLKNLQKEATGGGKRRKKSKKKKKSKSKRSRKYKRKSKTRRRRR